MNYPKQCTQAERVACLTEEAKIRPSRTQPSAAYYTKAAFLALVKSIPDGIELQVPLAFEQVLEKLSKEAKV